MQQRSGWWERSRNVKWQLEEDFLKRPMVCVSFLSFVHSSILPPGLWVWWLESSYFWTQRTRGPLGMVEGLAGRISWDWRTSWSRRSISACGRLLGRPLLSQYLWAMWLCLLSVKKQSISLPWIWTGPVIWSVTCCRIGIEWPQGLHSFHICHLEGLTRDPKRGYEGLSRELQLQGWEWGCPPAEPRRSP